MSGLMTFLRQRHEEVLKGTYYIRHPKTTDDAGIPFGYSIIDESDRSIAKLLNTLETAKTIQTIKTDDDLPLPENTPFGYVVTQSGELWQIEGYITKIMNEDNKQALRLLVKTNQTAQIMRLSKVSNPWGLK